MSARSFRWTLTLLLIILGLVVGYQSAPWFTETLKRLLPETANQPDTPNILDDRRFQMTVRIALTVVGGLVGVILGSEIYRFVLNVQKQIESASTREKIALTIGGTFGVLLTVPFAVLFSRYGIIGIPLTLVVGITFVYLSTVAVLSMKELRVVLPTAEGGVVSETPRIKILDTNVIIDGRIADICRTGFIEGPIYVPGFVIDELQHIADSSDSLRRARGRRGLDILNQMQKERHLEVRTYDDMVDPNEPVDKRLVSLAKSINGVIVTNDFNLNKVAELEGVQVLNVNELANALKPVVLPGEEMRVRIIKEGNQPNQGVGYMDDGTMIVVEGGREYIDQDVDVLVTSVLQTVAGKMIFASIKSQEGESNEWVDRSGLRLPTARLRRRR
ncbi:MAG: PIN domain-containing protein [Armatimonadota bacterium]|nr:PIN domain-containing protein [bacterium]MDW8321052.1 PIN domain-containing protein [Armatimonadota bacterium]